MTLQEAVNLAKQGNQEGFSFLYNSTYQRSYYVALKYLKNEDAALDVLQDSYVKAFQSIEQLEDENKFPQWLSRIVATRAINEIKRSKPVLFSQMDSDEQETDVAESFPDERIESQPELSMDEAETKRLVREIIETLSDEQRICVTMFYIEQMQVKEIAKLLGVSENTVKSRLNYGRQKIKEKVLELEKNGTKLYGIAPVAFFLWLLRGEESAFAASAPALTFTTAMAGGIGSGTASVGAAAATGAATATKAATAALTAKILLPVAGVIIASGIGVTVYNTSRNTSANEPAAVLVSETEELTEAESVPEPVTKVVVEVSDSTEELQPDTEQTEIVTEIEDPEEQIRNLYKEYVENCIEVTRYPSMYFVTNPESGMLTQKGDPLEAGLLGYYIYDFDADGQEELLTIESTGEQSGFNENYQVQLNMFEAIDGKVVEADNLICGTVDTAANGQRLRCVLAPSVNNLILCEYHYEWSIWCDGYYRGFLLCRYTENGFKIENEEYSDGSDIEPEYVESVESVCSRLEIPENDAMDLAWYANFSDYMEAPMVMCELETVLNFDKYELSEEQEAYTDSGVPLATCYVRSYHE